MLPGASYVFWLSATIRRPIVHDLHSLLPALLRDYGALRWRVERVYPADKSGPTAPIDRRVP
jgi:hypothetical protein